MCPCITLAFVAMAAASASTSHPPTCHCCASSCASWSHSPCAWASGPSRPWRSLMPIYNVCNSYSSMEAFTIQAADLEEAERLADNDTEDNEPMTREAHHECVDWEDCCIEVLAAHGTWCTGTAQATDADTTARPQAAHHSRGAYESL